MTAPAPRSATCPALLIAAGASGQGKTTVTAALARLHARQGRRVRVFKCGPDYLDPYWHQLASGAPVQNLDLWMTGWDDCAARLHAAAQEADLILIEGVMGLFDGSDSVADLAQRTGVPVLAVVDASAMGGTLGAIVHGLKTYRPGLPWAGVLANRVASPRHAQMLQDGLLAAPDWLGALPPLGGPGGTPLLPERHLGLVAAHELPDALQRLDAAADALAATPLGQLEASAWQRWATPFAPPPPAAPLPPLLAGRTIAVARDAAFHFIYPANLRTLEQLGAQLVFFSPVAGDELPACDALWLPGGYPELHAPALAANERLRAQLHAHVQAGKPLWAECGGLMALCESLTLLDGTAHRLWGLLPAQARMQSRLAGLGPQQLTLPAGTLRGHSFHYAQCDSRLPAVAHSQRPGTGSRAGANCEPLYQQGSVRASFFHPWFASDPRAAASWFGG